MRRVALSLLLVLVVAVAACATPVALNWPDVSDDDDDVATSPTPAPSFPVTPTPQSTTITSQMVVNTCWQIQQTAAGTNTIRLGANGLHIPVAGARLLLMQVTQGAPSPPAMAVPSDVGLWQRVVVVSASGTGPIDLVVDTLDAGFATDYSSDLQPAPRRAQACTIPVFQDMLIMGAGKLEAPSWDGNTGGVVAVDLGGTLTLKGPISANSSGFAGGGVTVGPTPCTDADLAFTGSDNAGMKGDGWMGTLQADAANRAGWGSFGSAGGGGNCLDAGGGGGSHVGVGGRGGSEKGESAGSVGFGAGGMPLHDPARLFFGGGGGGGHGSDAGTGGRGGGVVLLSLNGIDSGSTADITANGQGGGDGTSDSGGGGGGAGGTIYLEWFDPDPADHGTVPSSGVRAVAVGGKGGNVAPLAGCAPTGGPGGGGSGGFVRIPTALPFDHGKGGHGQCMTIVSNGAAVGGDGDEELFP